MRNEEAKFSQLPKVEIKRSLFHRPSQTKTTFNAGELVPIYIDENLPGDTFAMDTSIVLRTSTMIKPVMDNMFLDIYYFAVPNRLVWEHWKEFMGENTTGPWTQTTEYTIPQITAPEGGWAEHTIADYLAWPTKISNISTSQLYIRAYCLIWNEYFRDENLQTPIQIPMGDADIVGDNNSTYEETAYKGGQLLPVCKIHDYFTSGLPNQIKVAEDITIPLGSTAPVYGRSITSTLNFKQENVTNGPTIRLRADTFNNISGQNYEADGRLLAQNVTDQTQLINYGKLRLATKEENINPTNSPLVAELSQASAANILDLISAFKLASLYMIDARSGTRYTEIIQGEFGVISPDARLQRPEYLGGQRIPVNVDQVVQTSSTDSVSPQANVSAYSLTNYKEESFTKSFTEHGMILGLACVRTEHTYQQGIDRMYSRKRRLDFYTPPLAGLPEQNILNKEIYAQGTDADNETFAYQERWAEYKYKPSHVTGQMRSNATLSLDLYHYADDYEELPTLGDEWIKETKVNIDRTLAVKSNVTDQFQMDVYFNLNCARPMPVNCVPNLSMRF